MLTQLDDIIKRLSAFFLEPLINVLLLSIIVWHCSKQSLPLITSFIPKIDVATITSFVDFVKLQTNFTEIGHDEFVKAFPGLAGIMTTLTSLLASASWVVFLVIVFLFFLMIFLIDKALFAVGWLIPFDYEFDHDLYAAAHAKDQSLRDAYGLFDSCPPFERLYGIIRSVVSAKDSGLDEKKRANLVSAIDAADKRSVHLKAYVVLLLFALWLPNFDASKVLMWLGVALMASIIVAFRYVHLNQQLIRHDLDQFLSIALYSKQENEIKLIDPKENPQMKECLVAVRDQKVSGMGVVNRLLSKSFLRFKDSGPIYAYKMFVPTAAPDRQPEKAAG